MAEIRPYAFMNCTSLTQITIPDAVAVLYKGMFKRCTNLQIITFGGTVEQWNALELDEDWGTLTGIPADRVICSDGSVEIY